MTAVDFRDGLRALKGGKDPVSTSIFGKWLDGLKRGNPERDPKKDSRITDAANKVS